MATFKYPKILRCARHIATDQGDLVLASPVLRKHVEDAMHGYTLAQCNAAERWLAKLTSKQLECAAIGEREEQLALFKERKAPITIDALLDDIYMEIGF